jgi:hypothetical protein
MIYDSDSFVPIIRNDFAEAKKEILIVSPYIRKRQINMILEWLKTPLQKDIPVYVITRPAESYKDQEQAGICIETLQAKLTVIQKPDIYQRFIIIDNRLVWYGSISPLELADSNDTIMRLESRELVAELGVYTNL